MGSIVLTCKGEFVVSYEEASELVIYDMNNRKIVYRIEKPSSLALLEEILEEYDPWVIVSERMSPEIYETLRNMGLKVELIKKCKIQEYLENVFI